MMLDANSRRLLVGVEQLAAPRSRPPRLQGIERNIVVTTWERGEPKKYLHDLIASDRRNPTVNANGPLYGSPEYSTDLMSILDPEAHKVTTFKMPVRDADTPEAFGPGHAAQIKPMAPPQVTKQDSAASIRDVRAHSAHQIITSGITTSGVSRMRRLS